MATTKPASPELPQMECFDSVEDERLHRKQRLAASFRLFAHYGFDMGVAGHITARDPELHDHFWVNPFGMYFGHIRVSDLLLVNHDGEVVEGGRPVNRAAFAIHSQVHAARPDVIGCAHSHSTHGKTWSTLGRLLDPITQDACAFYQQHSVFDEYSGVVNDLGEGKKLADALGSNRAAILKNHGLLTVGKTVEAAAWYFISMEDCCRAQLMAEQVGTPDPIPHQVAEVTGKFVGNSYSAWLSFRPLYDFIVRKEPDLLD